MEDVEIVRTLIHTINYEYNRVVILFVLNNKNHSLTLDWQLEAIVILYNIYNSNIHFIYIYNYWKHVKYDFYSITN